MQRPSSLQLIQELIKKKFNAVQLNRVSSFLFFAF